jgi:hypothetical protein
MEKRRNVIGPRFRAEQLAGLISVTRFQTGLLAGLRIERVIKCRGDGTDGIVAP